MKIVIPSHKRHDRVETTAIVKDAILCVSESQSELYKEFNPETEIVTHPDSIIGLGAKRQWMYEHFKDLWMLDDDIIQIKRAYAYEDYKLKPQEVTNVLRLVYEIAVELGVYLFAISKNPRPTHYYPHHPLLLTGFVSGGVHGLREPKKSKLYYNTDLINNDFWISLLNAYINRTTLIDTRFCFIQKKTFSNQGGLAEFRTKEAMENDYNELKRYFGDSIELKDSKKDAKTKVKYALTGSIRI